MNPLPVHPRTPVFDIVIEQEDLDAVAEVLRSGWLTMGPRTEAIEAEFAAHIGVRHCVATSSCTTALHLACIAAGVGPGDEVIVPSLTFVATANAVRYCGGQPIFADLIGSHDLGIDPDHIESLITPKTKAIIPVHYAGYAVPIEAIVELCERYGLALIEDAAHAPDAYVEGAGGAPRMLGSFGASGCFSFFPNKVLAVGEGGCLVTDDDQIAATARLLRSQGMTATSIDKQRGEAFAYDVVGLGFNYRFDDPRAALLMTRFRRLHGEIERRRELVHRYRSAFADFDAIDIPYSDEQVDRSSCYLMGVRVDPAIRRDFRARLIERHGVQTTIYPATHRLSAYVEAFGEVSLPQTEAVCASLASIPLFPHLSDSEQDRVIAAVKQTVEGLS